MEDKKYIISEKDLRDLLYYYNMAIALESGGVDDWEWCSEAISSYVDYFKKKNNIKEKDIWLEDIVEFDIQNYAEVNKNE